MNRRQFIKLAGMAAVGISAPLPSETIGLNTSIIYEIKKLAGSPFMQAAKHFSSVSGCYIVMIHPKQAYQLKVINARAKYKHERHIARWEKRYGRKSTNIEGVIGTTTGVNIKTVEPICQKLPAPQYPKWLKT